MLSITTAVRGLAARIRRVASMPLRFGMPISITTTSGDCSSASRMLSRPSAASATTAMSGCFSSSARKPSRTTVWSSANKMRMGITSVFRGDFGNRQFGGDQSSLSEAGVDAQVSAQTADSLFHAEQTHAAHQGRIEADAVIAHGEQHAAVFALDDHFDGSGVSVPRRVVQSFLHQAIHAGLVLLWKIVCIVVGAHSNFEPGPFGGFPGMPIESRDEAEIVEHGGTQQ